MSNNISKLSVIAFLFLLIAAAFFISDDYKAAYTTQGMTINSISTNIPVTDNVDIKDIKYLIYATLNGGGQSIVATVLNSEINQRTGTDVEYDFNINVDTTDEMVYYPIHNTGKNVYKYTMYVKEPGTCSVGADFIIPWGYYNVWGNFVKENDICVYKIIDATVGDLDNPTVENSATISVSSTKDNKVYTKKLNTITQQSVIFKDASNNELANIKWAGNLVTGNPIPSPANYVATYISPIASWTITNVWTLSDRSELDEYRNIESNVDSNLRRFESGEMIEYTSIDDIVTDMQSELDLVNAARIKLIGGSAPVIGSAQTYVDRSNENAGKVRITLDRQLGYPTVVMNVNADWLGISIPTGQPKILSIVCPDFSSGDASGLCELNVKNIGSGTGTFVASMYNGGIFTQKYSSPKITFNAGESKIMRLYIEHGTSTQETTNMATFKVYDYNNEYNCDILTQTIHMTAPKLCIPNTIRVSGLNIYRCKLDGSGEEIVLSCPSGTSLLKGEDKNDGLEGWYCSEPFDSGNGDVSDTTNGTICQNIVIIPNVLEIPDIVCEIELWFEEYKFYIGMATILILLIIYKVGITTIKVYLKSISGGKL